MRFLSGVQIDHLSPVPSAGVLSGTAETPSGVGQMARPRSIGRLTRGLVLLALAAVTLLGQGERAQVDPRFMSPSSTLRTYWTALRDGNAAEAWECFVGGRFDLPRPGMLWFLPPSDLTLAEFRSLPVTRGRILVSYEVRYRPIGSDETLHFRSADELVRLRGEWRITRPIGDATMPQWRPIRRSVDI